MPSLISRLGLAALLILLSACVKPPVDPSLLIPPAGQWAVVEAAWYGEMHHGLKTASGEIFDKREFTAAHSHLPFGTVVDVRNLEAGPSVQVVITDRANADRGVDLLISQATAEKLGMIHERRFLVEYRWME